MCSLQHLKQRSQSVLQILVVFSPVMNLKNSGSCSLVSTLKDKKKLSFLLEEKKAFKRSGSPTIINLILKIIIYTIYQCFGSIFIKPGSRRPLYPDPDPSYFLTQSEKNILNYFTILRFTLTFQIFFKAPESGFRIGIQQASESGSETPLYTVQLRDIENVSKLGMPMVCFLWLIQFGFCLDQKNCS